MFDAAKKALVAGELAYEEEKAAMHDDLATFARPL